MCKLRTHAKDTQQAPRKRNDFNSHTAAAAAAYIMILCFIVLFCCGKKITFFGQRKTNLF